MKKILLTTVLFFYTANVFAQKGYKPDSVYYLFDTVNNVKNSNMWHVTKSAPYKTYTIQCSCLKGNGNPTFYRSDHNKGQLISKMDLKKINKISFPGLLQQSKRFLDEENKSGPNQFFFIERQGNQYFVYNMNVWNSATKIVSGPDIVNQKPDNSAFEVKGLQNVNSNEISKYMNEAVITSGVVISSTIKDDKSILLQVGSNYTKQDFIILIKAEESKNFDLPAFHYKKKKIRVTGKVFNYQGSPTVAIANENQIQIIN